ncbi:MAG: O-antigen ligase family protein [Bryobacteraceae bacterium]|jgi:O-antigen ligase
MTGAGLLAALLSYTVLTLWIGSRWAWSLAQIAVFAGLAVWALRQWRGASAVRWSIWLVPLAAAPVWGLLQLALHRTVYRWGTWEAVLTWTTWLAFFFLALQVFREHRARSWFLQFAVYFGGGLSILSTVQMLTSHGQVFWLFSSGYADFVLGPFVNRNQYAAFLETILPIALWRALRGRHDLANYALANYAMAAAMFASVAASASRAGTILMCAEAAAVVLLAWRQGFSAGALARGVAIFGALAVAFAATTGWQALSRRMQDPDPLAARRELLASSAAMLRDRPSMGFGLGNWARAYPQYALFDDGTYVNQAHDDWMQWAVEGGLPFLLALLGLAAMAAPAALRSVWGIGMLSLWVHCLVEYPLQQRPGIGAWFFALLGLLAANRESDRAIRKKT